MWYWGAAPQGPWSGSHAVFHLCNKFLSQGASSRSGNQHETAVETGRPVINSHCSALLVRGLTCLCHSAGQCVPSLQGRLPGEPADCEHALGLCVRQRKGLRVLMLLSAAVRCWCDCLQMFLVNSESFLPVSCRPHATDYATHKKVTLPLAGRCSRMQTIRILPVAGPDPECQRVELIKVCWLSFILGLSGALRAVLFRILNHRFLLSQSFYFL